MNLSYSPQGAITALITPFNQGLVDEVALRSLVDRQIESGIDGLVACGTTGESATLSVAEKMKVIEIVADQAKQRVPVIAGTGSNNTNETIHLTSEVSKIDGIDAALVVAPYYNKPNEKGQIAHFEAVAAQGHLPVIVYNVPGRTGYSLSVSTLKHLAKNKNIIAVKEASGDIGFGSHVIEEVGEDMVVLSGDDFTTFALGTLGGKGCISVVSNILPGEMSEMCHLINSGEWQRALDIHYKIQPLTRSLFSTTNPIPVKTAAALLQWCRDEFRLPLSPLEPEKREPLKLILEQLELM